MLLKSPTSPLLDHLKILYVRPYKEKLIDCIILTFYYKVLNEYGYGSYNVNILSFNWSLNSKCVNKEIANFKNGGTIIGVLFLCS